MTGMREPDDAAARKGRRSFQEAACCYVTPLLTRKEKEALSPLGG
jgi:hypothetical protein